MNEGGAPKNEVDEGAVVVDAIESGGKGELHFSSFFCASEAVAVVVEVMNGCASVIGVVCMGLVGVTTASAAVVSGSANRTDFFPPLPTKGLLSTVDSLGLVVGVNWALEGGTVEFVPKPNEKPLGVANPVGLKIEEPKAELFESAGLADPGLAAAQQTHCSIVDSFGTQQTSQVHFLAAKMVIN